MKIKDIKIYDSEKDIYVNFGLGLMEITEIVEKENKIIIIIGTEEEEIMKKTYSAREASEKTGIGIRTIQRKCAAGDVGQKIGRDYRLTEEDIEKLNDEKT